MLLGVSIPKMAAKTSHSEEQVAKTILPEPEPYVIPDPCGLEVVLCEGEEGYWDSQVEKIIRETASNAGLDPDHAVILAQCESSLDTYAMNETSGAKGLFQFLDSTWKYIGAKGDPYNPYDSSREFVKWYPLHPEWWVCE